MLFISIYRLPTEFSARLARNTQIILQEETGIPKVSRLLGALADVISLTYMFFLCDPDITLIRGKLILFSANDKEK